MNLHRCRSCGLKLETGDICQRCQDIDVLAQDIFSPSSSNPKKNYSNLISVQECQEEWSEYVSYLRERLLQMVSTEGMRIFSGIETDPVKLAQQRASLRGTCSFSITPPEEAFILAQPGSVSYYPLQWSWEELDPNIENFTPELVADRKSCMEPEDFAAFIDRMAGNVKKAFNIED